MYQYYQPSKQQMPQLMGLKGRPVSSLDEVRAAAIDFDGSISYFPNLANDTIYTKQINMDGTSTVRMYELVETPSPAALPSVDNLVTKEEFSQTVDNLMKQIQALQKKPEEFKF